MRWLLVAALLGSASAFYLPGVAPREYLEGEDVNIKVNNMDSTLTQLPYDYYYLDFCKPEKVEEAAENLGEVLSGDVIQSSAYKVKMNLAEECKILCKKEYSDEQVVTFQEKIKEQYRVNWIVDNMPAGVKYYVPTTDEEEAEVTDGEVTYTTRYDKGFDLGFVGQADDKETETGATYLHNHHRLIIAIHSDPNSFEGFRIVGFEVDPFSVKHEVNGEWRDQASTLKTCTTDKPVDRKLNPQPISKTKEGKSVIWTYDVRWEDSDIKWASRWDLYLKMQDSQIHWFSIINSIMIVLFLSGMVAMIILRTLHRDLRRYNELQQMTEEDREEETGWKLIHGDVFRPPRYGAFFSVLVGTGVQVFMMALVTLVFAALGFLSPANRGGLMTALLVIFVFMGFVAGYFATRVYLMFKLTNWKRNATVTALLFPGIVFAVFFILNLFVWGEQSSGAVPFVTLLALLALWLCISAPLCVLGGYVASKREVIEPPVRVNNIPRVLLDDKPWYAHPVASVLIGGLLPFGAVLFEIFFIMTSIWLHRFYYVFGFLFIVFIILIITCAEITIVMTYFQLCNTDYHWWWRSFFTSGASALYLFLYSIFYFFFKLEIILFVSALLFFGYMILVSMAFFLMTGTIGYFSTYFFVRKIYSAVKID